MNQGTTHEPPLSEADIYRALRRGLGHEHVTDENVATLIDMAREHGEVQTEYLLRQWHSLGGADAGTPALLEAMRALPPPMGPLLKR